MLFTLAAAISILAVALICVFLFANGLPAMFQIGIPEFLLGTTWKPGSDMYGIFPMIVGSIYVTAGAILVGVPAGILTAIYLSRFAGSRVASVLRPGIELLAGIPSVVYGFFGLMVLVPFIRVTMPGRGLSLLAASLLLGIMILPTIITVAKNALDAVPRSYYEGALALGATHERAVFHPRACCVLGNHGGCRAGSRACDRRDHGGRYGRGKPARHTELHLRRRSHDDREYCSGDGLCADLHRGALIATGVVLFVFIMLISLLFSAIKKRGEER